MPLFHFRRRYGAPAFSLAALLALFSCICAVAIPASAEDYRPGETYYAKERYVEYQAGDLPLIFSAPHGGREKPDEIPDRAEGVFAFDTNTQELIRAVAERVRSQTGASPHVVICRVHRRKVDCNREVVEAAGGNPKAEEIWEQYHDFLTAARKAVVAKHGRGLFIDFHGHGHAIQRVEIGYLHSAEELMRGDRDLNNAEFAAQGSLRSLTGAVDLEYAKLLRGPTSFGALLEKHGVLATPSPSSPRPPQPYFRGGYTTQRHARDAPPMCGMQLETNWRGVRDTAESRAAFARALEASVREFVALHLKLELPKK